MDTKKFIVLGSDIVDFFIKYVGSSADRAPAGLLPLASAALAHGPVPQLRAASGSWKNKQNNYERQDPCSR